MTESEPTISNTDTNANKFDGDWVKEHRQIRQHKIWECDRLYKLWRYLIMEAKWQDDVYSNGQVKIPLKRGQLVGGLQWLSEQLHWPKSRTNFKLNSLRKLNAIRTEVKQGLTVITILNYEKYQCAKNAHETQVKRKLNASETGFVTQVDPSKEVKTEEAKKEESKKEDLVLYVNRQNGILPAPTKPKPKKILPISSADSELGQKWLAYAKEKIPSIKSTLESFVDGVHRARIAANLSDQQMSTLFRFIVQDEFWASNAYSPCGLIKKSKNGLRKIDNIIAALRREKFSHIDLFEKIRLEEEQDARDALNGIVLTNEQRIRRSLGI